MGFSIVNDHDRVRAKRTGLPRGWPKKNRFASWVAKKEQICLVGGQRRTDLPRGWPKKGQICLVGGQKRTDLPRGWPKKNGFASWVAKKEQICFVGGQKRTD